MRRLTLLLSLSVLLALLAGCVPMDAGRTPAPVTTAAPTVLPVVPSPLPSSTTTSAPAAAPTSSAAAVSPTFPPVTATAPGAATNATPVVVQTTIPEMNWQEWDAYTSSLRPEARQGLALEGMTQYHLFVDLSDDLKMLRGAAYIHYTNRSRATLDSVYLHLYPNLWHAGLQVSEVSVDGRPAASTLESDASLLKIAMATPLAPGVAVDLSLGFEVPIPSQREAGNYGEFALRDGILALAHFYPTVAVYDEKGWHRETPAPHGDVLFHEASLYDVVATVPSGMKLVATGHVASRTTQSDGRVTWRIVGGPQRDFNLVASTLFQEASQQVGEVTVYSHFLPDHAQGGQQVLKWASTALSTYERMFGPYPYQELHVAEIATSAGGIEYPGLVVIARSLYDAADRADFFESATVHEVAHQWWYNVVGNDQVNEPWLDEALAQYSTYFYYQAAYGAPGANGFLGSLRDRWQRVDNEDKPVGLPVADYTVTEYSAIVYGRGPLFLLAVQDQIGQAAMTEALRRYYRQYAWRIAHSADLQNVLQEVAGQDLTNLFDAWVYPPK